ncbi:PREDICTED: caffeoylshikimate esterase isoform X1 [Camelina sativa]|uniref:Caffeoylshikimate esterase isoform X1 n=1 Tax=Camelina sativa TaxID=90675 RepID=A0ABM0Z196_CAMSA|nr:PREDICTED: caffeoylshikimate esterase isoform X1 [Camelina sativa]
MQASQTDDTVYEESFINNSRGMKLFTCKWVPAKQEPKALVFICHGYAMECSITMNSTARRLVKAGFAVYGIDYEGHGKSDGLSAYVPNFDQLVDDVSTHYTSICEREENKGKMRFLLGESMGGAVLLLLHRKKPEFWDGAILAAPMCKIAEEMKPNPLVISILSKLSGVIPSWKIIPGQDIIEIAFKQPEIRKQVKENPYCYKGRPRLKTAYELLRVSTDLEKRLNEVSLPFMVLHGEDDKVTDKAVSGELYEVASSWDKTLKLYPGMWHGLLYGETPENIDLVFADIIGWLDKRASDGKGGAESERKRRTDGISLKG